MVLFMIFQEVNCSPVIEERDFQKIIRQGVTPADERILRAGMTLLGDHADWVWRNAAIRCIGNNIDYIFFSESRTNKFVVSFNEMSEVNKRCSEAGWRMKLRNGFLQVWGAVVSAAAAVAPFAFKAITYN